MTKIFLTAFVQVLLVSLNTIFLSKDNYTGVTICAFLISYVWCLNVKKVSIGSRKEQIIYASGACIGSLSGLVISKMFV